MPHNGKQGAGKSYAELEADNLKMLETLAAVRAIVHDSDTNGTMEVGCYCSEVDGMPLECVWCRCKRVMAEVQS